MVWELYGVGDEEGNQNFYSVNLWKLLRWACLEYCLLENFMSEAESNSDVE